MPIETQMGFRLGLVMSRTASSNSSHTITNPPPRDEWVVTYGRGGPHPMGGRSVASYLGRDERSAGHDRAAFLQRSVGVARHVARTRGAGLPGLGTHRLRFR